MISWFANTFKHMISHSLHKTVRWTGDITRLGDSEESAQSATHLAHLLHHGGGRRWDEEGEEGGTALLSGIKSKPLQHPHNFPTLLTSQYF